MRFLIFNIVVAGALAFLVMDRPDVSLARSMPDELPIPPVMAPVTETQPVLKPQKHAPVKAEPAVKPVKAEPKVVEKLPELPPAQEVPVRTTHKAPRDVSPGLQESAEAIKAEITARQSAPVELQEPQELTQTVAMDVDQYDKAVSRRKALLDLASDMENMFAEKMMR